eukprot:TRINITY_DN9086_c0_g1_i11.p1 TRINITY_DN9086_c0_g1~~TRINITY_DN9086_c0_g1_i11.p1  ORF type:complete len:222 (-),score=78.33 TRINITY_DN9086_c0_g1_i11:27-671(-)
MIRRPPRSTPLYSSAASDVYKRQVSTQSTWGNNKMMNIELEELGDLIDALKNCNKTMKEESSTFNSAMGMPVFIHIERKLNNKIQSLALQENKFSPAQSQQFKELKKAGEDLIDTTKKEWSEDWRKLYEKELVEDWGNEALEKPKDLKELTAGVKSLTNLALMLSKDTRGRKDGRVSITRSDKKDLKQIDEEQQEFENYQMKFAPQNETCCLIL